MRLEWLALAERDRAEIFDYIEADNPRAAADVDLRIREQSLQLLQFPLSGRPGRVRGTRELVISHTSHILVYRVKGEIVRILRLLHGARRWPARF